MTDSRISRLANVLEETETRAINHPVPAVIQQHWPFFWTFTQYTSYKKLFCVYLDLVCLCMKIESQFLHFYQHRLSEMLFPDRLTASDSDGGCWYSVLYWGCFVVLQWYAARGTRQMIRGGIQVPRDPVTWPTHATWRQRQMAWVPALAVGISVISLSARQGEQRGGEKNTRELFTC